MDESARVLFLMALFFYFFKLFFNLFYFFLLFFTFFILFFKLFFTFFYFFCLIKKPSKIQTKPNAPLHIQPAEADTGAQRDCHHGH